jgi:diamine N-acetyltransferase
MKENTHIRQVTARDVPVVSRVIRDSFRDVAEKFHLTRENCPRHPSNCEDSWVESDLGKGIVYYLLERDSEPAGCVAFERSTTDVCVLERLAVLPESRGNGFGQALVEHVFDVAREQGFRIVSIAIIANHDELKNWYQRLGFVERETKTFPHLPFLVAFMTCELV